MLGQKVYSVLNHKCAYCDLINRSLYTYQLDGCNIYVFENDFVIDVNNDTELSFIKAYGYCKKYKKGYIAKVGIKSSRLTRIVIIEK